MKTTSNKINNKREKNNLEVHTISIQVNGRNKNKYDAVPQELADEIEKIYLKSRDRRGPQLQYPFKHYLNVIMFQRRTSIAWNKITSPLQGGTYYKLFRYLVDKKIIDNCFKIIISNAYNEGKLNTFSCHADTTDVLNMYGTEEVGYGHKFKNKMASRVGIIMAGNVPIGSHIRAANIVDCVSFEKLVETIPFVLDKSTKNPSHLNVDKGYTTTKNVNIADKKGLILLGPLKKNIRRKINRIRQQRRMNTKINKFNEKIKKKIVDDPKNKKIYEKELKKNVKIEHIDPALMKLYNRMARLKNRKIYRERFVVESINSTIKKFACVRNRYDKYISTFNGTINLILMNIAFQRINKIN